MLIEIAAGLIVAGLVAFGIGLVRPIRPRRAGMLLWSIAPLIVWPGLAYADRDLEWALLTLPWAFMLFLPWSFSVLIGYLGGKLRREALDQK